VSSGILPVTAEILEYTRRVSGANVPFHYAVNGFFHTDFSLDLERDNVRKKLEIGQTEKIAVIVGYSRPWHGVERAIDLIAELPEDVKLWLVGGCPASEKSAAQHAKVLGVEDRIRIIPYATGTNLSELLTAADFGLGALALDRKKMYEAQPMKVAVYVAHGLPVLYNYSDRRFNDDCSYAVQVSSDDPSQLVAGAERILKLGDDDRLLAKKYAESELTWESVARDVGSFITSRLGNDENTV
jgi:glycosyltransferase involved in cell wall biosynthesis